MKISINCANCDKELALYGNTENPVNMADLHEYAMRESWQNIEISDYDETDDLYFCPNHFVKKEAIGVRPELCGRKG